MLSDFLYVKYLSYSVNYYLVLVSNVTFAWKHDER